jgi:hypothetical protein
MSDILQKRLSDQLIDAAFAVHLKLGPGTGRALRLLLVHAAVFGRSSL